MIKNSVNRSKQSLLTKVPYVKWGKSRTLDCLQSDKLEV